MFDNINMHGIAETINKEYKIRAEFIQKWSGKTPSTEGMDAHDANDTAMELINYGCRGLPKRPGSNQGKRWAPNRIAGLDKIHEVNESVLCMHDAGLAAVIKERDEMRRQIEEFNRRHEKQRPQTTDSGSEPRPHTSAAVSGRKTGRSHRTQASRKITSRSGFSKGSSRRVPSINGMSNVQPSARSGYSKHSSSSSCCYCRCDCESSHGGSHAASSWRRLKSQNRKKGIGSEDSLSLGSFWSSLGSTNASSKA